MQPESRTVERTLARLAARSHGVVTRAQLERAGVTPEEIKQRVRRGALIRVHRGVYRVGHVAPSLEARYLAAVLACGDGALLSGRAAAYLLGLLKGSAPPPQVTTLTERRVPGIRTRRVRGGVEGMRYRGIPVTSVPQTVVDLAAVLRAADLARAFHEAGVRHGTTPAMVEAILARHPRTPGARKLRTVIRGDTPVTLSELERRFLERLEKVGLPLPITNRPAGAKRVDCRWPEHCLTVELDSYRFHSSRYAWEQDRRRERIARARGDEFRRYTHGDVFDHPALMLAELRELLGP